MADHFAEICSSTPRVPWTNDRRRSLGSFRRFIRSSTGSNPSTDCQSRPRAASPQEHGQRDPLTQLSTRGISLTASRSSFYCSLLSLTSPFFKIRFSTGFLTSRPSYFFARAFFICPVYRFPFSNARSFSPERSHPHS